MTYSRCTKCWIALYMYDEDLLWVWSGWHRTYRDPPASPTTTTSTLRSHRANNRLELHPYASTAAGAELYCIYIQKIWYEYERNGLPQTYPNTHYTSEKPSESPTKSGPPYIRLVLHLYDRWPQQMMLKRIIYAWWRSDMSWKWIGCLKHILNTHYQWKTEWVSYDCLCAVTVRPGRYQVGVSSSYDHWPQLMMLKCIIYAWWRPDMSMKWIGCLKHILTHITSRGSSPKNVN
jgi:hypothetical protein